MWGFPYRCLRLVAESVYMGVSMFRTVTHVSAALALWGLVLAQPALAGRSSDSLPVQGARVTAVNSRVGTPIGVSDHAASTVGSFVAGGIGIATLIIILTDKHHNKSPG